MRHIDLVIHNSLTQYVDKWISFITEHYFSLYNVDNFFRGENLAWKEMLMIFGLKY
jgi:hypothetical protein